MKVCGACGACCVKCVALVAWGIDQKEGRNVICELFKEFAWKKMYIQEMILNNSHAVCGTCKLTIGI